MYWDHFFSCVYVNDVFSTQLYNFKIHLFANDIINVFCRLRTWQDNWVFTLEYRVFLFWKPSPCFTVIDPFKTWSWLSRIVSKKNDLVGVAVDRKSHWCKISSLENSSINWVERRLVSIHDRRWETGIAST